MGLAASRQLEAHLHAVNSAGSPNHLFEDDKALTEIWKLVPAKHKSKLGPTRPRSKRVDRLPKINSTTSITLNPSIEEEYNHWKDNPKTILQHTATPFHSSSKHPVPIIYHQLVKLEKQTSANLILHRFLCVKLYRLKSAFQTKKLRATSRENFQSLILESGLTEAQKTKVAGNLERWIRAGARYLGIASELGGTGALILLPDDISSAVWEELLPRTGTEFENMMTLLKRRGLCVEAMKIHANEVAAGIETVIGDDWSVCQFKPGRSSNCSSDRQPKNTPSTMLAEKFSNGTKIAPSGDEAQMIGWLGSQTDGPPVGRDAVFGHCDDAQSEVGHFHTDSSTSAAETLTYLRQTAVQHIQPDIHGGIEETVEEPQDELLDPGIERNPTTSFDYYDPSTFSQHYSAYSIPPFPFHYHDPNTFSQSYGSDLPSFPFDSTHDPNNFSAGFDMNAPILST